ncbi:MAG: DUF1028 domain-containing protein [Phycisphaerae bacterium]
MDCTSAKTVAIVGAAGVLIGTAAGFAGPNQEPAMKRPVSTFSIVARDPATGEIGVAVQSHWFSVGSVVPWAEAGVGAVATQSLVNPAYGPDGLDGMRAGRPAAEVLKTLVEKDDGRAVRQVAMIDAHGRVVAHTGAKCIAAAGQFVDADHQFSVQANMMTDASIWPAMAKAYREHRGDLADRLIAALEAAQTAGGDIRGRQSAAILVVKATATGKPWVDRRFDLRVEDHPHPVQELKRVLRLARAYAHMNAGDAAIEKSDFKAAGAEYAAAETLAPHIVEIPFWTAVSFANAGRVDEALPIFRRVFAAERRWVKLVPRLVPSGLLPDNANLIQQITSQAAPAP